MQTVENIRIIMTPIAIEYGVKRLFLFGSYAKGLANEDSDVDLLIEKGTPLSLLGLSGFRLNAEKALELPVDLVASDGINDEFREEIARSELLLYEE